MRSPRVEDIVGLDIGADEIKVAVVRDDQAVRIGKMPLPKGTIVAGILLEPDVLAETLKQLWHKAGLRSRHVNFSVINKQTVFRRVPVPLSNNPDDLHLLITTNSEVWFAPLSVDDLIIDFYEETTRDVGHIALELVGADKQMISIYVKTLRRAGLIPVAAQYGPLAESKVLALPRSLNSAHALVDVGAEGTAFTVVNGQDVLFSSLIDIGGNDFTEAAAGKLSLAFPAAEKLKCTYGLDQPGADELELVGLVQEALLPVADKLVSNLADKRNQFERQPGALPITGLTLIGGGARLSGLAKQISIFLGLDMQPPVARLGFDAVPEIDLYAGAISLAWQSQMSLLPATTAPNPSKKTVRPKVDRERAKRLSKQLRRKNPQANPLLLAFAFGLVICALTNLYGRQLAKKPLSDAEITSQQMGPLNYTNPTPEEMRLSTLSAVMIPPQVFRAVGAVASSKDVTGASLKVSQAANPGNTPTAPAIVFQGIAASADVIDNIESTLKENGVKAKNISYATEDANGIQFQFRIEAG